MLKKTNSVLKMDSKILLHTRLAQSLFDYSWQHGKMGLLQFAKLTSTLWKAMNEDDPYADWFLVQTYQALNDARDKMKLLESQLEEHILKIRGIAVNPLLNTQPVEYPLQFATFFSYQGASLLADADYVIRQILTLKKLGKVNSINLINDVVKCLQDVFAIPRQWRHTGVTRQDFKEDNQKAADAQQLLGELPDNILKEKTDFSLLNYANPTF